MIKAVIFDCFGVLTSEGLLQFIDTYFSDNEDKRREVSDVLRGMNTGHVGRDEAIERFAELAGVDSTVVVNSLASNNPDASLFDFIRDKVKPSYKIGMLSNAGADRIQELFGATRAELFDDIVLSYQVGMAKPDAGIYELAARRLGVLPEECIFVDDQLRYCEAAESFGMTAICHTQTSETIQKIEKLIHA